MGRRTVPVVGRGAALAGLVAFVGIASPAPAAVYTTIGQAAPGEDNGGCSQCNVVQRATGAGAGYAIPHDGVLTRFGVKTGSSITAGEWVQLRTFRLTDATHAQVISESAPGDLTTPSAVVTFWDHVPAAAGDVLGARFHTNPFIAETPNLFTTANAGDIASNDPSSPGPEVGGTAAATGFANTRVNIQARLEHDDDHDGYGDGSQDLCLGDGAHATTACSGALFGSDLQGPYKVVGFACGYACARVQLTLGGSSTAAPANGVVVRWRLQAPPAGGYRIRVIEPGGASGFTVARSSDPVTIGADEALHTFTSRLPIAAGGYVALVPPAFSPAATLVTTPPSSTYANFNDAPDGSPAALSSPAAGAFLYDADIEPDADGDGFGDATQDQCPTQGATQGACAPVPEPIPPPGPPGSGPPAATNALITAFSVRYPRFRVRRTGAIAAARRAHAGTAFRLTLTAAGRVRLTLRRNGKTVHAFSRALRSGRTTIAYSGRYRRSGRVRTLRVGTYRVQAAVVSADGSLGAPRTRSVKVVH